MMFFRQLTNTNGIQVWLFLFLFACFFACSKPLPTEKLIVTLPEHVEKDFVCSEDGIHWCYQVKTETGFKVVGDRTYSASDYEQIGEMDFNAKSGRCGFWALKGNQVILVVDGNEYVTQATGEGFFEWTRDGRHWIAVWTVPSDKSPKSNVVMFDGKEIGRFPGVKAPVFSHDSRHYGFLYIDGHTVKANIDGKVKELGFSKELMSDFWHASPLSFLKNGQFAAIVPKTGTQRNSWGDSWGVVKGEELLKTYPNSFIQVRRGSTLIQLGGEEKGDQNLPTVAPLSLAVNEAGTALAWWARPGAEGTEWYVYVDGRPIENGFPNPPVPGDHISLSPDGRHAAWRVRHQDEESSVSLSIDGKMGQKHDWLGGITFSPNSSRHAYWVKKPGGNGTIYNVDEKEIAREFDDVMGFVFSPDSTHFAYIGKSGLEHFLILDGQEHRLPYNRIWGLRFLEGGRPVFFGQRGREIFMAEGIPIPKRP